MARRRISPCSPRSRRARPRAAPAAAHVQVTPSAVAPGDPVTFTVVVPGEESEAHTTEVALQVPKGVLPFAYEDQPGWRRTLEQAPRRQRRRGPLARPARDRRLRALHVARRDAGARGRPRVEGGPALHDGHEAAWIGAPDSENPAPVTRVTRGAAARTPAARARTPSPARPPRGHAGARRGGGGRRRRRARRSASSSARPGLVLGAVALVVALRRRGRGPRREARAVRSRSALAALLAAPALAHQGNPNFLSQVDAITPRDAGRHRRRAQSRRPPAAPQHERRGRA